MNKFVKQAIAMFEVAERRGDTKDIFNTISIIKDLVIVNNLNNDDSTLIEILSIKEKLQNSISFYLVNNDSENAKHLMKAMMLIDNLAQKAKSKNLSKTYEAEKLLTTSIDNSVLICTYSDDKNRGIGKSTELLKLANKLDIALVTNNHHKKGYLDDIAQQLQIPVEVRYFTSPDSVQGMRMKNNKFLVDEGVTKEVIDQLLKQGNELVGGFVSLHTLGTKKYNLISRAIFNSTSISNNSNVNEISEIKINNRSLLKLLQDETREDLSDARIIDVKLQNGEILLNITK